MGRSHANDAPATLEVRDSRTGKTYSIPCVPRRAPRRAPVHG
jgi:hypothetical protein